MGNGTAIKGTDLAVSLTSGTGGKSMAARQVEQTDGGFQKLLNSKAEEDAGAKETTDTKKDDKKEVSKDEAAKKPETKDQPEETTAPADTALEQVQAALLFQIQPEIPVEEAVTEEVTELVTELTALPAEEMVQTQVQAEQPVELVSDQAVVPEEALEVELAPEQTVLPTEEEEEEPELGLDLAKPKETGKAAVKEETKVEGKAEQPLENIRPETPAMEQTPVTKEVPTEHVRVSQPEEIPEKLLNQLLVKTTAGIKEFEIQLEPYDLGKIIIKAAFGKEHTSISIMCTEQRTMELMAKNARELGAIMEENLGTPTTIVVEDKEAGYLEQQNQNKEGNSANQNQEDGSGKQGKKDQENEGIDFLQQLRLGLI